MGQPDSRVRLSFSNLRVGEPWREEPAHETLESLRPFADIYAELEIFVGARRLSRFGVAGARVVRLGAWVELLSLLLHDRAEAEVEHAIDDGVRNTLTVAFRRTGDSYVITRGGGGRVRCDAAALLEETASVLESLREAVCSVGPIGARWWEDHTSHGSEWLNVDDTRFFAHRHSWMYGPCFEVHVWPDPDVELSTTEVEAALVACAGAERAPTIDGLVEAGSRWILQTAGQRKLGVRIVAGDGRIRLVLSPHQVARACRLGPVDSLCLGGPAPTPQARAFLLSLAELVGRLAHHLPIHYALLTAEGQRWPSLEAGWTYLYAWAAPEPLDSDRDYGRRPLRTR